MDPMLEEAQLQALQQRFQTLVEEQGAEVRHIERWERRRLAYDVKGRREGYYVVMNFAGEPKAEAELGRVLRITEGILRHLIVRLDDRIAEQTISDQKAAAEARAKAEAEARAAAEIAAAAQAAEAAEAAAQLEADLARRAAEPPPPPPPPPPADEPEGESEEPESNPPDGDGEQAEAAPEE